VVWVLLKAYMEFFMFLTNLFRGARRFNVSKCALQRTHEETLCSLGRSTLFQACVFKVWAVYASLSATPPPPLIRLPFNFNGRGTHRFVPTTVHGTTCQKTLSSTDNFIITSMILVLMTMIIGPYGTTLVE
jgi:hypothetical protein